MVEWRTSEGLVPYEAALSFMEARVADIAAGRADRDGVMVAARHVLALATPCLAVAVARGAHAGLLSLMGPVGT